jgi:hypothetical protein
VISHYVKPPSKAARLLIAKHGAAAARKHALQELRNARRARSRIRFTFWATVIAEIDAHCPTGLVTRRSEGPLSRGPANTPLTGTPC